MDARRVSTWCVLAFVSGLFLLTALTPGVPRSVTSSTPEYPFADAARWLPHVRSLHLRADIRFVSTPAGLDRSRQQLKDEFPDLKDPDPLDFTGLLPILDANLECAFDRSRLRYQEVRRTAEGIDLSRDLRLWDGKRAVLHWNYTRSGQIGFRFAPTTERVVDSLWRDVSYLAKQPPAVWWNKTPGATAEYEQSTGKPADFVLVGRETYHGVECAVWLSTVGNQSDRYYVGLADGRWYGAREGIIAMPPGQERTYRKTVEEFLGRNLGKNPSAADWAEIDRTLRSLPRERKVAWARLNYERLARHYTPVFEYWFSDFRDLGDGRAYPYREDLLFHDHEGQEITFVSTHRILRVKELRLDRPLGDHLFQEPLIEGAQIVDEVHQPRLHYKHKARFTPQEWQAIVQKARDEHDRDAARRRVIERLIGTKAPPLPANDWINSKPLQWADLRGKIVVLKFWAIGCAPCYRDIGVLRGAEKDGSGPTIVYIGVHAPGNRREDIVKVVKAQELAAPICVDQKSAEGAGEFFDRCAVNAMPTSVAVDEEGRILAHGSLSEVLEAAAKRREKLAEKK
jgi:thiol-disulfide isomerase/thioredoxin